MRSQRYLETLNEINLSHPTFTTHQKVQSEFGQTEFFKHQALKKIRARKVSQANMAFTPELNRHSLKLAQRMGSSTDRLLATREIQNPDIEQHSYKPQINKNADKLDTHANGHRWETLYNYGVQKINLKKERKLREDLNPTYSFTPDIIRSITPEGDVLSRGLSWTRQRDQKLSRQKSQAITQELEGCTHSPIINRSVSPFETLNHCSETRGVSKFLERQQQAQKTRSEIDMARNRFNGETWKRSYTPTKEFTWSTKISEPSCAPEISA